MHLEVTILRILFIHRGNFLGYLTGFCALSYEKVGMLTLLNEVK